MYPICAAFLLLSLPVCLAAPQSKTAATPGAATTGSVANPAAAPAPARTRKTGRVTASAPGANGGTLPADAAAAPGTTLQQLASATAQPLCGLSHLGVPGGPTPVFGRFSAPAGGEPVLEFINHLTSERQVVHQLVLCSTPESGPEVIQAYVVYLERGTWEGTLSQPDLPPDTQTVNVQDSAVRVDFRLRRRDISNGWFSGGSLWIVPFLYVLLILLVRWHNIALPARRNLYSEIRDVKGRLIAAGFTAGTYPLQELEDLQAAFCDHRDGKNPAPPSYHAKGVWEKLLWSRGAEIAGWQTAHSAELWAVSHETQERVDARLITAVQELLDRNTTTSNSLADQISAALKPDQNPTLDQRRAMLREVLSFLYDAADTDFAWLTSWQNKAFWMILVGVLLAVSLGAAQHHEILLLAGAAGGFLSRTMRALKRADLPTDYGASWTTLFLSPVSGALAGWFGIAIITLLTSPKVGLLSGPFSAINWDSGDAALLLGMAFALGFSERLFDKVLSQLDDAVDKKNASSAPARAPVNPNPNPASKPEVVTGKPESTAVINPPAGVLAAAVKMVVLKDASGQPAGNPVTASAVAGQVTFIIPAIAAGPYAIFLDNGQVTDAKKTLTVTS